jgi:hypothetical protein
MTLYDHAVVAAYSLAFQLALLGIVVPLTTRIAAHAGPALFAVMSLHLFTHLRGVYGGSVFKTLLRMTALAWLSLFAFLLLLICWLAAAGIMVAA